MVGELEDATLARLVTTARRLLKVSVASARTPVLNAYARTGRHCRRCGTLIRAQRQGRDLPRTTYWCERCQGGPS
jgi:formamidopyrimidine-DNA glycosylase